MGFGFDNEVLNLCDFNFTTSCFNFFCGSNEIVSFNLTNSIVNNSTFREEYFNRFNYCLYCNNNDAKEFQEIIASSDNNICKLFPIYNDIINLLTSHCNNGKDYLQQVNHINNFTLNNLNIGMIEQRFFSDKTIYRTKYLNNLTSAIEDNTLHFIQTTFQGGYSNPVMCYCSSRKEFGFQCDDAYQKFFIPFKFKASNVLLFVYSILLIVIVTIIIIIPHCHVKIKSIQQLASETITSSKESTFIPLIYFKSALSELFLTDLTSQVIFYLIASLIACFIENLMEFIWNFKVWNLNVSDQFWGVFRGVGVFFVSLTYCMLLVQWSHLIYFVRNNITSYRQPLSRVNFILYISLYIFNFILILIGVIISAVLDSSFYFFTLCAISMIIYPVIFLIGFSVYGIIIFKKLRKSNTNIYQLKFTKFILVLNVIMTIGIVVAIISAPSFILNWDLFGIFLGLNRNFIVDVMVLIALTMVAYIIFKKKETLTFYSKILEMCNCCSCCNVCIVKLRKSDSNSNSNSGLKKMKSVFKIPTQQTLNNVTTAASVNNNDDTSSTSNIELQTKTPPATPRNVI
ncbi:hypothetical protein ABK040_010494 [Willaertia magna]